MYVYCGRSQTRGSGEIANDDRPVGPKALGAAVAAALLLFLPPLNRGRIYDDVVLLVVVQKPSCREQHTLPAARTPCMMRCRESTIA